MIIPLHTDSPLRRTPWMNWLLIGANVIMFLVQQFIWKNNLSALLQPRDLHLYQYFTYGFLHADVLHLAGNMLFLYIFGNNVNDRMGQAGYLGFYLSGQVFAGIGHVLTSTAPVLGASGAVSAVTGAFLVLMPKSHVTVFFFFYMIGTYELPSMYFIIASFLMDFVLGFTRGGNVAHTAHLAGSVFGFAVSLTLLVAGLLPRNQFDLFALAQRWNRRRQYRDMVTQGYDPFSGTPGSGKRGKPDPNVERIAELRGRIAEYLAHQQPTEAAKLYLELHAIDPTQVLARQNQLDVANQLYGQGTHGAAADAYAGYLKLYAKSDHTPQVNLMLGLLYARYLNRIDLAKQHLQVAKETSRNSREIDLAAGELQHLQAV